MKGAKIPTDRDNVIVRVGGQEVRLTNLRKPFWPALGITKGGLLQFYLDVAPYLLPHIKDRAMVMRRYPDGADGPSFFMKEAPTPRPPWIRICPIEHGEGKVVRFPVIDDEPSLLWCVNLGCIDLNQWYSRCDDIDRPDYLHFDLDPSDGAGFDLVRKAGLIVRDALTTLGMKPYVKTSGSRGLHVYVPIVRGPLQERRAELHQGAGHGAGGPEPEGPDRRVPASRSGPAAACWWTIDRTPGARRWRASIRSARSRRPPCRCR